jgi:hypothetical protein
MNPSGQQTTGGADTNFKSNKVSRKTEQNNPIPDLRTGAPCLQQRTWAEKDGATRISCHAASPTTADAAFIKESRMEFANAD